jgi:cytochrome c oxidase subunit III
MPGAPVLDEIKIIIEDIGKGRGKEPPSGGDGGGDGEKHGRPGPPSPRRYYTGIALGIVSILMFFMALASAYLVQRATSSRWVPVHLPVILWANTMILLASSATMEQARKRLSRADVSGFRTLWLVTTMLGLTFLAGQLVAWRLLVAQGIYVSTNQGSSFFYIFTAVHAAHLLGGISALIYVYRRNFETAKVSLSIAAEVTSYYWHFMDGLWLFLLALLYLGK